MTLDIPGFRLNNQFLSQTNFTEPGPVVAALGAVQSQDYAGGKWALGLRMKGATDAVLDQAFNEGRILRTHILRPTWHFVAPEDIRWMLALSAPRVHTANGVMYRQQGLDETSIKKSYVVLKKVLQGGKSLTRPELGTAFEKAGIKNVEGIRLGYFIMSAELDGIICSGPRRGKQFTYALLEERAPTVRAWKREESLAEMTRRYFATRGPATLHDFTWWSGLTMADVRRGLDIVRARQEDRDGRIYWRIGPRRGTIAAAAEAHLLPVYDEYLVAYRDREAVPHAPPHVGAGPRAAVTFQHPVVSAGQVAGTWRPNSQPSGVRVVVNALRRLSRGERQEISEAAGRYGRFLGTTVSLSFG